MIRNYKPQEILTQDEMWDLVEDHAEKYGTDIHEDYNSMYSRQYENVTIIYSKEQPRINQNTGKNLKYFPELYVYFYEQEE